MGCYPEMDSIPPAHYTRLRPNFFNRAITGTKRKEITWEKQKKEKKDLRD